jgi:hypothetical protein
LFSLRGLCGESGASYPALTTAQGMQGRRVSLRGSQVNIKSHKKKKKRDAGFYLGKWVTGESKKRRNCITPETQI